MKEREHLPRKDSTKERKRLSSREREGEEESKTETRGERERKYLPRKHAVEENADISTRERERQRESERQRERESDKEKKYISHESVQSEPSVISISLLIPFIMERSMNSARTSTQLLFQLQLYLHTTWTYTLTGWTVLQLPCSVPPLSFFTRSIANIMRVLPTTVRLADPYRV